MNGEPPVSQVENEPMPGEPRGGRGAGQVNGGPPVSQVENDSGETETTDNNPDSEGNQLNSTNNVTTANDVTGSPSLEGVDTENPGGGGSTGGQESQNEKPAGAEERFSTPMRLLNMAGAGLKNTPRRLLKGAVKKVTGFIASDQGNEDRGEVTTED